MSNPTPSRLGLFARHNPIVAPRPRRPPPTWQRLSECARCIGYPPHLRRTIFVALTVGTVLFAINQLNVVAAGHATAITWLKVGLTYVVPFCTSNFGLLVASRRRPDAEEARN